MTLKEYIEKYQYTYRTLGMVCDIDWTKLWKFANGKGRPSLPNAYKIYMATDKQVGIEDWFKDEEKND